MIQVQARVMFGKELAEVVLNYAYDDIKNFVECIAIGDEYSYKDVVESIRHVMIDHLISNVGVKDYCYNLLDTYDADTNENDIARNILELL